LVERKFLRRKVSVPGKRENSSALVARNLRDNVGGAPESIDAEVLRDTSFTQTPVANEPCTHEGSHRGIRIGRGQEKTEPLVCDHEIGKPAVKSVAREPGVLAEILVAGPAIAAFSTRPSQPGNANPVADLETPRRRSTQGDMAHHFVAED
jgi:hypothetical protein